MGTVMTPLEAVGKLSDVLSKRTKRTEAGCLEWQGARSSAGYGELSRRILSPYPITTHRIAWMLAHGAIPDGMSILHRCDNPACCEPTHLFLGTDQDNTDDKMRKGRHRHGHLYGDDHPLRKNPALAAHGEHHGMAKLTTEQVNEIRALIGQGVRDREIAGLYGVARVTITAIRHNRIWRSV